jgi:hypothetical protein
MISIEMSTLTQINFQDRQLLPKVCAVYIVLNHRAESLYVGKAKNLRSRWNNHHRLHDCIKNNAHKIAWIECDESEMPKLEQEIMLQTRPLLNGVPTLERKLNLSDYFGLKTGIKTNWYASEGFTPNEALALLALVLAPVHVDGKVYASQVELAAIAKCARPTLNKGLKSLIERGLVSKVQGGKYQINECVGTKLA